MNNIELGRKIKEARISKKMTQSEVVGNFITRNMLSQIESGNASPSIKTLEYISGVLNIPLNQLMSEDEYIPSDSNSTAFNTYLKAKSLFKSEKYAEALNCLNTINDDSSPLYDEVIFITAKCYYYMAEKNVLENNMSDAASYAKKSSEIASEGIFGNRSLKSSSILLLDSIADKL